MVQGFLRWIMPLIALFVAGPVAGLLFAGLRAADGATSTTALVAASPLGGLLVLAAACGVALLAGFASARVVGTNLGLFSAGLVLAWAAWASGTTDMVLRQPGMAGGKTAFVLMGVEAAVLLALAAVLALIIGRAGDAFARSGRTAGVAMPDDSEITNSATALAGAVTAAVLATLVFTWVVAREPLKGQCVAAATVGGLAAGAAAVLISPRVRPVYPVVAVMLAAVVTYVIGPLLFPTPAAPGAAQFIPVTPILRLLPIDYAAGSLLGVPMGMGWAHSMIHRPQSTQGSSSIVAVGD